MSWWLKRVHWTSAREDAGYWRRTPWVSDAPGRSSDLWKSRSQPALGEARPFNAPHYEIGDLLVVCIARTTGCPLDLVRRCPAILKVTGEPRWNPGLVDGDGSRLSEGDRWGVVTNVVCVNTVDPYSAPMVESIGVVRSSLNQKGFRHLDDEQGQAAQDSLELLEGGGHSRNPPHRAAIDVEVVQIPIEQGKVEVYEMTKKAVERARRDESKLVTDFADYLTQRGDSVHRHKIKVPGSAGHLYSDLYNETRRQLIEAKASIERADIRMAIGQLADYARFIDPASQCAVLLEAKPRRELRDLLSGQGIATIWRDGEGFTDDADGHFT